MLRGQRLLTPAGRRGKDKNGFFNNYEHISFNAGPTLLSWLEQNAPHVYEKILEGDRASLLTRGSGNAIAQVYNHIILPLASERDRKTQIIWSLEGLQKTLQQRSTGGFGSQKRLSIRIQRKKWSAAE